MAATHEQPPLQASVSRPTPGIVSGRVKRGSRVAGAVLIATDDLESLEETIAILSDPDTLQRLATSDVELARGEGESETDLAQAMAKRRTPPA